MGVWGCEEQARPEGEAWEASAGNAGCFQAEETLGRKDEEGAAGLAGWYLGKLSAFIVPWQNTQSRTPVN